MPSGGRLHEDELRLVSVSHWVNVIIESCAHTLGKWSVTGGSLLTALGLKLMPVLNVCL